MSHDGVGECHCGRLAFAWSGSPRFVGECACESCRRCHGATAVAWVGVADDQFSVTSGTRYLTWYRSSEASERGFCQHCGTRVLFRSSRWPGEVHMALACITRPTDLRSTGLAFRAEFPAWSCLLPPARTS